jgi:hypothetical protein
MSLDAKNCGACGKTCGDNATCSASTCTCATGYTDCSGACVDTKESALNCGTCGTECTLSKPFCNSSACEASPCSTATDAAESGNTNIPQSTYACFRIKTSVGGGGISNGTGCKAFINGVELSDPGKLDPTPALSDGYVYLEVSGCTLGFASFYYWK